MKKNYLLFVFITMLIIGIVGCGTSSDGDKNGDNQSDNEVLVMGTSADYPPFESRNTEGDIVGFDIEIANYIADELGMELEIRDMNFDGLIGALQANRVDLVLSGMSATEDRRENVDFSIEYHRSGEMFVTKNDQAMTTLDDLNGMTVGVQLGSIQEEGAKNLQADYDFEIKSLNDAQVLIQELMNNRIDAVYLDKEVALGFIEAQELVGFDDPSGTTPGMAVAFPKDSDLVEKVNQIIEQAIENGKLAEWEAEWLSGS